MNGENDGMATSDKYRKKYYLCTTIEMSPDILALPDK